MRLMQEPRFDLLGAIRTLADGGTDAPRWRSSYERMESDRAREEAGLEPSLRDSIFVPLTAKRDLTTENSGAYLIGQGSPGGIFMQSLQGASIASRLGVQMLPMGRDNGAIPVITTPPTTQWLSQDLGAQISTSQPVIGSRQATPKAISALVTVTRTLLTAGGPIVEQMLMSELSRACAAAVDDALFNGAGNNGEPTGILATPGITSASGADLDWSDVCDLVEDTVTAGAAMVSPGFACDGPVQEILLVRAKASGTGQMMTDDANRLAGYPLQASKTGPATALVFADWSTVYLPTWGALELRVDPFTNFTTGRVSVRAVMYCDTLIAHAGAVAVRTSVS
jgi:HK97 family phage major capsid protein